VRISILTSTRRRGRPPDSWAAAQKGVCFSTEPANCHEFVVVRREALVMPSLTPVSVAAICCLRPTWTPHRLFERRVVKMTLAGLLFAISGQLAQPTLAQQAAQPSATGWQAGIIDKALGPITAAPAPPANGGSNTGPNLSAIPAGQGQIKLKAMLTDDQSIDQGLVWRVFAAGLPGGLGGGPLAGKGLDGDSRVRLVATQRETSPQLRLPVGDYVVNVSFGRASLTRRIAVKSGDNPLEKFVLNAGGLRLVAFVGKQETPAANAVTYDIYSDERDQFGQRAKVLTGAKPGLMIRLNSGLYHLVSTYGDANATVQLDVTVEPGKLTEATIAHAAGKATFKLVTRAGGDAVTDTQWSITTPQGEPVKESVGALPTHTLIPGTYIVTARQGGKAYRREFKVTHGSMTQVEVMRQ
jgi:hypothetical protein